MTKKEEDFMKKWQKVRADGMLNFLITKTISFSIPLFLIMTFFVNKIYDFQLILVNLIINIAIGLAVALWAFNSADKKYEKLSAVYGRVALDTKAAESKVVTSVTFKEEMRLETKQACAVAILHAWVFALLSASIALIFGLISLINVNVSISPVADYHLNVLTLVDGLAIFLLAYFVRKKSRIAIVLLLTSFIVSKGIEYVDVGLGWGVMITLLYVLIYANGARAIFIWHSRYKNS
jgi:hypothetical protein